MSRFSTGRDFEPNLSEDSEVEDGLRRESEDDEDLDYGFISVDDDGDVGTSHAAPTDSQPPDVFDIDLSAILCKTHALQTVPSASLSRL